MVAAATTMPVPPSTTSIGRYTTYTPYTPSYSYRSGSYVNRTTSLDRSTYATSNASVPKEPSYSSSNYTSSYSTKYSTRPPRPSYSSTTDTYRSSRSCRVSPVRTTYSRLSSDSHVGSDKDSKYSSTGGRARDGSNSRDSGYGSRVTSRDRSIDFLNGNGIDVSSFGPSFTSYASNYRWEGTEKSPTDTPALSPLIIGLPAGKEAVVEEEKPLVSERVRVFEYRKTPDTRDRDLDNLAARRRRLGLSPARETKSRTPQKDTSPDRESSVIYKGESKARERRPSVSELCRKYDTNHNNVSNGVTRDDDNYVSADTLSPTSAITSTLIKDDLTSYRDSSPVTKTLRTYDITNRTDRHNSPISNNRQQDILSTRVESPARIRLDSPARLRVDSPARSQKESPSRTRVDSPSLTTRDREDRSSPLLNGTLDKPKSRLDIVDTSSDSYSGLSSTRTRYRRDRVRDRIAARLALELEDEGGSPPPRRRSPTGGSNGSTGSFSENNGLVGLRNIGNTCFLNSVTQCLSNTRFLMEYLVRDGYSSDINSTLSTMKGDLVTAFAALLSDMWREGGDPSRALNTGPFKSQIQRFAPAFTGYQQHDAQEFLRKLLEGLHEDVNRVNIKPRPITEDIQEDLDDGQKAIEAWKRYLRYDDSKIVDMFVGQLKSSLQCSICGHCSVTFDPFWDLSLPIPSKSGQVRLSQCLDLFTKEEVLDGDERPTCSKCKERRKMTKSFSIQKFPKVLVLHLKRFSPLERWRGKLSCTVEFPVDALDLSRYASNQTSSCAYNLIGVANHSGTTYSGHYTAYCRHPYSGSWHEYNDSRVSSISISRVCSSEAYVLSYELISAGSKL